MQPTLAVAPFAALLLTAGSAVAQENAVASATDAFGERVGIEQLGLYDEGQVRGFSLEASGAYRINDAYFARSAWLNDPVLGGVSVRVGAPAASLAYPQPSGVVVNRLREPTANNQLTVGGGYRDFGTPVVEANGSWRSEGDRFSITGGAIYRPEVYWGGGTNGRAFDIGAVVRWKPAPNQTFTAFASSYSRQYNGDYAIMATGGALPPTIDPFSHDYTPYGARFEGYNTKPRPAVGRGDCGMVSRRLLVPVDLRHRPRGLHGHGVRSGRQRLRHPVPGSPAPPAPPTPASCASRGSSRPATSATCSAPRSVTARAKSTWPARP